MLVFNFTKELSQLQGGPSGQKLGRVPEQECAVSWVIKNEDCVSHI